MTEPIQSPENQSPVRQNIDSGLYNGGVAQEDTCFTLTAAQQTAVELVGRWYAARNTGPLWPRQFVLAGPAGSGKSSVIKYIISHLGLRERDVLTCAYTGKAALNLLRKGCPNSCTLHHAIYNAEYNRATREWTFTPKHRLDFRLVIVDEASMLPEGMYKQLMGYNIPVLYIGDHCQLPPVDSAFNLMLSPDFTITEIVRQAAESPIIRASQLAIKGKPIPYCAFDCFRKIRASQLNEEDMVWPDQIVVGTNRLKDFFNAEARRARGFGGAIPECDERMVVLKNSNKHNVFNGQIVFLTQPSSRVRSASFAYSSSFVDELERDNAVYALAAGRNAVAGRPFDYRLLSPQMEDDIARLTRFVYLDYGYAISCHRAQGSGWDKVLVVDSGFGRDADTRRRWLYTAITRAKKEIVIVTM